MLITASAACRSCAVCVLRRQYGSATYDWKDTDGTGLRLALWVNDTSVKEAAQGADSGQTSPGVNRWNAGVNLASNTYLQFLTVQS